MIGMKALVFGFVFFPVTVLSMGLLAMAYGKLTREYITSRSLTSWIYIASCSLSIFLGVLWITLNATGYVGVARKNELGIA